MNLMFAAESEQRRLGWSSDSYIFPKDFFESDSEPWEWRHAITLDNSGVSDEQLRYLIGFLRPRVCMLPNVAGKAAQTIFLSERFLAESNWIRYEPEWMAVVQGRTRVEFENCFMHWLGHPDISVIGIPSELPEMEPVKEIDDTEFTIRSEELANRRLQFLRGHVAKFRDFVAIEGKQLHLIDSTDVSEIYTLTRDANLQQAFTDPHQIIRSHNTSAPFKAARAGHRFSVTPDLISYGDDEFLDDLSATNNNEYISDLRWNKIAYLTSTLPFRQWPVAAQQGFEEMPEEERRVFIPHLLHSEASVNVQ